MRVNAVAIAAVAALAIGCDRSCATMIEQPRLTYQGRNISNQIVYFFSIFPVMVFERKQPHDKDAWTPDIVVTECVDNT
jgi:hypothetical protein